MSAVPAAGLRDPVHDAQHAFRIALEAMARPGRPQRLGTPVERLPLGAALAYLLLTLTDEDTPVWWQQPDEAVQYWLRFHTGAPPVRDCRSAAFAVITDATRLPSLQQFGAGSLAAPEQSCTLLVEVPSLEGGPVLRAHGPGIAGHATLSIAGLPADFWPQWQASHAAFPQGVDVFFTCGDQLLALPRSTRVGRLEEV